ncbi:MAG: tyrosine--tRNA ligase [Phycisphaerales bacterium]|nr:tyrosine--tRNA ligase [Phycisphaerales bacterium]
MSAILDELSWRGLLHQTTADEALKAHLGAGGRVAYCGFDPTADSLTIGNYIAISLLAHWQRAGHKPIVLVGGGTGLIGDPSGKDAERQLLSRDQVGANIGGQRRIFERVLDFDGPNAAVIVNNADWLCDLGYLQVLRDVGKHFSVNAMIQKESVKERLHNREQGISYTEFSYMLLQAYDFLHLRRSMECTVQLAGSDQYGNIVSGIDLIRRDMVEQDESEPRGFGITSPLVTKADGGKIGKTESGAIWLTADRTSPWSMYQYFLNCTDADASSFLRWYTFRSREEVEAIEQAHAQAPHQREAQRTIARDMTALMHGADALAGVERAAEALFGGDVAGIEADMLDDVFADVPSTDHSASQLQGEGVSLAELLPETSLAQSRREAREFLRNGSVSVNGCKIASDEAEQRHLSTADLLHGRTILLKRGKKAWHATRWG